MEQELLERIESLEKQIESIQDLFKAQSDLQGRIIKILSELTK